MENGRFFQEVLHQVQSPKTPSDFTAWDSARLPKGPDWCWKPKGSSKERLYCISKHVITEEYVWKFKIWFSWWYIFCAAGMTLSTLTWMTNQTGSLRGTHLVMSQHWKHLLVKWSMSLSLPVNTWMRPTLRTSCFLPHLLVKLNRRWCWRISPRYLVLY